MKKLIGFMAALVMSLCFVITAQANVLEGYDSYKGTFTGQEVVFTSNGDLVQDPTQLAQTGLEMYALAVISTINTTQGPGSSATTNYPPVFTARLDQGTYFSTLTGLTTSNIVLSGGNTFDLYFTGGTMNWYYSEDGSLNDTLQYMRYNSGLKDYAYNGATLGSILTDPFLIADLTSDNSEYTGKVSVTMENGMVLRTDFTFYANMQEGYELWQSGEYGNNNGGAGFDMELGGKLVWESGRFYINDGNFRVSAPAPEPSSIILMSFGLLVTAAFVRRQKNK